LRCCCRCNARQFTHNRPCIDCSGRTVGLNLLFVFEGTDRSHQAAAEAYHKAKRNQRLAGILNWVAVGTMIPVMLLVKVWLGVLFTVVAIPLAVLIHLAVLSGVRALYRRQYGAPMDPNTVLGATQQLERFSDDVVHPFLARNGIMEGRPIRVPEEEITLLAALFRRGAWFAPGAEPVDWVDFLTACALRRDFVLFRQRIEYYPDADPIAVYANLHPKRQSDRLAMPFLQEILSRTKRAANRESVEPAVEHYRAEFKLTAFSKDLEQRRRTEAFEVSIEQVDRMNPFSFEELLGMIYEVDGYRMEVTKKSGDQGADVIIEKAGERCVVQAKLYSHPVGNGAVQEVLAARTYYKCQRAIVVTNNSFTRAAIELASSGNITLIGREELIRLLSEFNKRAKDYARLAALMTPAALRIEALPEALPVVAPGAGTVESG